MRLLIVGGSFSLLLALASCAATSELPPPTRADTVIDAADFPSVGKLVFRGPVTIQTGGGNTSTTVGKDKTGQRAQAVSTGDGSPVTASEKKAGPPLTVYLVGGLLLVLAGAGGWEWLSHRGLLAWLPWRARNPLSSLPP